MSFGDAVLALGLGIWFTTIAAFVVLTVRLGYECWQDRKRDKTIDLLDQTWRLGAYVSRRRDRS